MQKFFLTHKNPLSVVLVLLLLGGLFAYSKLQTSLFPDITFPKIKVIADAGLQPVNRMMADTSFCRSRVFSSNKQSLTAAQFGELADVPPELE